MVRMAIYVWTAVPGKPVWSCCCCSFTEGLQQRGEFGVTGLVVWLEIKCDAAVVLQSPRALGFILLCAVGDSWAF